MYVIVPTEDVKHAFGSEGVSVSFTWQPSTIKSAGSNSDPIKGLGANYRYTWWRLAKKTTRKRRCPSQCSSVHPCGLQTLANDQPQITKYLSVNGNHEGDGVTTINVPTCSRIRIIL